MAAAAAACLSDGDGLRRPRTGGCRQVSAIFRSDGRVAARNRAAAFHAQTQRAPQKAARER